MSGYCSSECNVSKPGMSLRLTQPQSLTRPHQTEGTEQGGVSYDEASTVGGGESPVALIKNQEKTFCM